MRIIKAQQQGSTVIGLLLQCLLLAFLGFILLQLFPLYYEAFTIETVLKNITNQADIARMSNYQITTAVVKNFEITEMNRFDERNIHEALIFRNAPDGKHRTLTMSYESRAPLIANLDAVLKFEKRYTIPGSGVE